MEILRKLWLNNSIRPNSLKIPYKSISTSTIVLKLKYNCDADSAIDQIHRCQHPAKVAQYIGDPYLVDISYDRKKTNECQFERHSEDWQN